MTATDRLNAMEARCDAATEGPWEVRPETSQSQASVVLRGADSYPPPAEWIAECGPADCNGLPNAGFIAAARTDLPATIAALRAVLGMHTPGEFHPEPGEGLVSTPDDEPAFGCQECRTPYYPCYTVRAITEALT